MTIRIEDADAALAPTLETPRNVTAAMSRGAMLNCPSCGDAPLFERYLKVADTCPGCHEALHHHRADDAPPYFTIFIVGHFIVGGVLAVEQAFHPEPWVQASLWLPLTVILSLLLLPRIKGALVGLQWALRMHGFGDPADDGSALTGDGPGQPAPRAEPAADGVTRADLR
jgi:uncharacterized protein (DUF983 family)